LLPLILPVDGTFILRQPFTQRGAFVAHLERYGQEILYCCRLFNDMDGK
jgi:hypothetical protein